MGPTDELVGTRVRMESLAVGMKQQSLADLDASTPNEMLGDIQRFPATEDSLALVWQR